MTVFFETVQARIFKCGTYICRMSDCIVELKIRVMAFIFLFLFIFLSFPIYYMLTLNFYVGYFSRAFKART